MNTNAINGPDYAALANQVLHLYVQDVLGVYFLRFDHRPAYRPGSVRGEHPLEARARARAVLEKVLSIERAKAKFEDLKKRGYAFFALKRVTKFRDSNGTELVASKSADALRAPVQDSPEGPVRRFEPDEHREVVAVPPRRGG